MRFSQNLSSKRFYARFFFLFIIYLGINLFIMRQKSRNYFVNMKNIFGNFSIVSVDVIEDRENADLTNQGRKTSSGDIPINGHTLDKDFKIDEKVMEQILLVCKENNLTGAESHIRADNFFYSPEHSGLFCWIRKAASTSFAKIFSDMNAPNASRNNDKEIWSAIPKTVVLLNKLIKDPGTFKFLAVRHPFERLVSAYRDRIEDNSKYKPQAWLHVPKIFKLTRPDLFRPSEMLEETLEKIFHQNRRLKLVPTFEEFVRWLLQEDPAKYDTYWDRYYEHCSLCSVRYNYGLKLDNYTTNELDYILGQLNLGRRSYQIPKLEETRGGRTNFDQTCNYFKNLSHASIVSLYEKYRIDFEMFNYDFDKYFECSEGD